MTDEVMALLQEEDLLKTFIEYLPSAVAMFDTQLRYLAASRRWYTDYGLSEEAILGRCHYDIFPEIPQRWKDIHARNVQGERLSAAEDPFPRGDGKTDYVRWENVPWRHKDGTIGGVIMFTHVVTETVVLRKTLERISSIQSAFIRKEHNAEEVCREILEAVQDLTHGKAGILVMSDGPEQAGSAPETMAVIGPPDWGTGWGTGSGRKGDIPRLFAPLVSRTLQASGPVTDVISGPMAAGPDAGNLAALGLPLRSANGTIGALCIARQGEAYEEKLLSQIEPLMATLANLLQSMRREKERVAAEQGMEAARLEAKALAQSDHLTGLANWTCFTSSVERLLTDGTVHPFSLVLMDIDRFRDINDAYGHRVGDSLLKSCAARLAQIAREIPGAVAARMAGDEFALLVPGPATTLRDGRSRDEALVQELVEVMRTPVRTHDSVLYPTVSAGVANCPLNASLFKDLHSCAHLALHEAKAQGRNTWWVYTDGMNDTARRRNTLLKDLREQSGGENMEVWYQPQVSLADGRVCGLEALMRWTHPDLGRISPAEFIPLAEDNGLIRNLTKLLFDRALQDAKPWLAQGLIDRICVNFSAHDFRGADLSGFLLERLDHFGVAPQHLEVEVTESLLLWNLDAAADLLGGLGEAGIHVALDDFGTGYCNLAYLQKLPITTVKIDRSFIGGVAEDAGSRAILETITKLAQTLNLNTVAEGVETPDQVALLKELGCDTIQGYFASAPLGVDQCTAYLARHARMNGANVMTGTH